MVAVIIGKLDRRVSILRRTLVRDQHGEERESWSLRARLWAEKVHQTGREYLAANAISEDTLRVYRTRYRGDILVTDRLEHEGLAFEIHDIRELARKAGLELQCRALRGVPLIVLELGVVEDGVTA